MNWRPVASITEHFERLPDPRVERTKQDLLQDILTIAICGVICGADSWVEMEQFGEAKESGLRTFLKLPNGIPRTIPSGVFLRPWIQKSLGSVFQAYSRP